jgi:hypothetical protein
MLPKRSDAPSKSKPRGGLATFARANPVVVVTWLGAVAYFVARAGQTSFYSKFGLEPEDVGLGYAQTLSRAAVGLLLILLFGSFMAAVVSRLSEAAAIQRDQPVPPDARGSATLPRRIGPVTVWAVEAASMVLVLMALFIPPAYTSDAHHVKDGKSLRPAGLSSPLRLLENPLGLRVEPVHVSWVDKAQQAYDFGGQRVMYLGHADGFAAFFGRLLDLDQARAAVEATEVTA